MPTMLPLRPPEPWNSFLTDIDALLQQSLEFHCFGGFPATMLYGVPRTTQDIDVLPIVDRALSIHLQEAAGPTSELRKKHKVYIDIVTVVTYPEDYDQRLRKIFPGTFKNIRTLALDPYDLVLMKLERSDRKDRDDVLHIALNQRLDLEVLKGRYVKEYRPYVLNEQRIDAHLQVWIAMIEEARNKPQSAKGAKRRNDPV
jgi:hypothetical protein